MKMVKEALKKMNLRVDEAEKAVQNQKLWRTIISNCVSSVRGPTK